MVLTVDIRYSTCYIGLDNKLGNLKLDDVNKSLTRHQATIFNSREISKVYLAYAACNRRQVLKNAI